MFKSYSMPERLRGIDDLMPEYIFVGSSQGDETRTNSLKDYLESNGWLMCILENVPKTQEEIDMIVFANKEWNKEYINELKSTGRYKESLGFGTVTIMYNPVFDK